MPEKDEKIKVSGFRIFLKVMVMFVLLGYIIFSFIKEGTWINNSPCEELVICIKDSARANSESEGNRGRTPQTPVHFGCAVL